MATKKLNCMQLMKKVGRKYSQKRCASNCRWLMLKFEKMGKFQTVW